MKIFLTSIFAQTLLTLYIMYRVWYALPSHKAWRISVIGMIIAEELLFFLGYFFHQQLGYHFLSVLQIICGTWFIASLYFGGFLLVLDSLRAVNHYLPFYPKAVRTHYGKIKQGLLFSLLSLVIVLLGIGYYSYLHPKVNRQTIHIAKKAGKRQSVRIAFATDIHTGYVIDQKQLRRYVDLINQQECDMIVLGGDMMDHDLHPLNQQNMADEFRRLKAPLGVYAILGNHEYRFDTDKKISWLREAGLTVLRDSVVMPDFSFYLVGRDDKKNENRKTLSYLLEGLDREKPILIANHQPTNIVESIRNKADFEMMGHVHDGQIWPYNFVMNWYWNGYSNGYMRRGDSQFFISSGLGLSGPPFRIFTDSEVVVFDIRFDSKPN